ncbi:hypothetical protein Y1Q_0010747 [Alligator mississippiensis]|uniref:Uncharacterized protein n=1 Tax=Alligator mississippiensis TaxID=8496 RepID=A0A151M6M2_ALLMI|nr:hypothetical protein Y1Q_0010747 [Alligator mississippiensis]
MCDERQTLPRRTYCLKRERVGGIVKLIITFEAMMVTTTAPEAGHPQSRISQNFSLPCTTLRSGLEWRTMLGTLNIPDGGRVFQTKQIHRKS